MILLWTPLAPGGGDLVSLNLLMLQLLLLMLQLLLLMLQLKFCC